MKYYYLFVVIINIGFVVWGYIMQNGIVTGLALFNIILFSALFYKKLKGE